MKDNVGYILAQNAAGKPMKFYKDAMGRRFVSEKRILRKDKRIRLSPGEFDIIKDKLGLKREY
ncbi:MAG: hypothetical protein L3J67_13810 [Hyphomicrobiaceae bacterium]|nr:hypothetical protein [Hyphomicrobiaceae bacterium]